MKKANSFRDLIVWQKAHELVLSIYQITKEFPRSEMYGLTSQIRRAAVSIPANIAEGFRRKGKRDKAHFFNIAESSLAETEYYMILANDLAYARTAHLQSKIDEISKLLYAYSRAILTSNS
jgi:four helix bundle protein